MYYSEIGKEILINNSNFIGVYEHLYDDSIFGKNISTHYIVLAYKVLLKEKLILLDSQHSEFLWLSVKELLKINDVHVYTKNYFVPGN